MPPKSFALSRDPQTASRFVKLPAELLLKVLRYLLKQENPIEPFSVSRWVDYQQPEKFEDYSPRIEFSSQILRCCQVLNQEGTHILYSNIPEIHTFWDPSVGIDYLSILGVCVELPDVLRCREVAASDLISCRHKAAPGQDRRHSAAAVSQACELFRRFIVIFATVHDESLYLTSHLMRTAFTNKEITITWGRHVFDDNIDLAARLEYLRILRCSSINIIDTRDVDVTELTRVITSGKAPRDLFACLNKLLDFGERKSDKNWELVFHSDHDGDYRKLLRAMFTDDTTGFDKYRSLLLNEAKRCKEEDVEFEVKALLEEQDQYHDMVDELADDEQVIDEH